MKRLSGIVIEGGPGNEVCGAVVIGITEFPDRYVGDGGVEYRCGGGGSECCEGFGYMVGIGGGLFR